MSCGPGKGLEKLNGAKDKLTGALDGLIDGADGIMGKIDSLAGELDSKIGALAGDLKTMLPAIELPELPEMPSLEGLLPELPELPSLQGDIKGIMGKLDSINPLEKLQALADLEGLKEKFPDIPNIDGMIGDITSGKIDLANLCKEIPNIELDELGKQIEKGIPSTAPEIAAIELEIEVTIPDPGAISAKAIEMTEALNQVNMEKAMEKALAPAAEAIEAEISAINAGLPFIPADK
jgi:hypothetical protein